MNHTLSRLIHEARRAIDRGDMYVGQESDFPGVREWSRMMDIPVGVFEGRVLLKLHPPWRAITKNNVVSIVAHYGGVYYALNGERYTINEIALIEDKRLP